VELGLFGVGVELGLFGVDGLLGIGVFGKGVTVEFVLLIV